MRLPSTLTTVTAFSKLMALLLFIIFILAGFYLGAKYQERLDFYKGTMHSNTVNPNSTETP